MKDFRNTRDSYKIYKESSNKPVLLSEYLQIVNSFFKFLVLRLIDTGFIILPERLGTLQIIAKKPKISFEENKIKGLSVDWKETKKLWEISPEDKLNKKLIYYFNEETEGYRYRYFWSKKNVLASNKTYYDLVMTRSNKRLLAKVIKSGNHIEYLIKN